MLVSYDIRLVAMSVIVAIIGAHAGLIIMSRPRLFGCDGYKKRVILAALVIGGAIWVMHFVGMLALHLPIPVDYAILPTLVSALVGIVFTGLGLYAASSGHVTRFAPESGGALMGLGIAGMHYIGMEAIRAACIVTYSLSGVAASVFVGMVAARFSLKLLASGHRGWKCVPLAAIVMGMSISAMHYVGMAATQFADPDNAIVFSEPVLDRYFLACVVALMVFLLCDVFIFMVLPGQKEKSGRFSLSKLKTAHKVKAATLQIAPLRQTDPSTLTLTPAEPVCLPVQSGRGTRYVPAERLVFIAADGHYTKIGFMTEAEEFRTRLCAYSISRVAKLLPEDRFLRVHRSYLVNSGQIRGITRKGDGGILMLAHDNFPRIPVSRSRLKSVMTEIERRNGVLS